MNAAPVVPAPPATVSKTIRNIRWLIYLYIVLLVLEGALRKWVVPQLSNPLLVVRDPFVLAIYLLAFKARIFPRNGFIVSLAVIAVLSWIASVFVLEPYFPMSRILFVTAYGVRSDFLHLPLIFIFPSLFDENDVKKMGRWFLIGMIPMGLLMALQFRASPDSFINRTVGLGEGEQITAGGGRIRPPGTFSFISGAIYYVTACTAFVLQGASTRVTYRNWLLIGSGIAIGLAIFVSGSRSMVLSVVIVVLALGIVLLLRPDAVNRFMRNFVIVVVVALLITRIPIVQQGMHILSDRFIESAEASQTTIAAGLFDRFTGSFTEGLSVIPRIPIFGYGLGVGTNAGARALIGRTTTFLLAENEWSRVLLESGPILGLAFLIWRTALFCWILYVSLRALVVRANILPFLLFSTAFILLLIGQLGQPTSLGFAVVLGGMCLASIRGVSTVSEAASAPVVKARVPSRSVHAARLHRNQPRQNGSVDR